MILNASIGLLNACMWTRTNTRERERIKGFDKNNTMHGIYNNFLASFKFSVDCYFCCAKCFINMLPVRLGKCFWENSTLFLVCFLTVNLVCLQFNHFFAPVSFTLSCDACRINVCPHTPYYDHITNIAINLFQHKNHHSFPSHPCRWKFIQSTIRMWRSSIKHYQFAFVFFFFVYFSVDRCEFLYQAYIKWFICTVYW